MKKFYLSILGVLIAGATAFSQEVARDWSKTDCDGGTHSLYSELDEGKVIILEYVMMNCSPCVTAAKGLKSVVASFSDSHPGRVHLYTIGYTNEYTCEQMQQWRTNNGIFSTVFTGGADDVEYYGGMGMPTVVVTGGTSHKIYYSKQGYLPANNTALKEAIAQALAESTTDVQDEAGMAAPSVFPNPAGAELSVSFDGHSADRLIVVDMTGREVADQQIQPGSFTAVVDTRQFAPGTYSVRLLHRGEIVHSTAVVVGGQ